MGPVVIAALGAGAFVTTAVAGVLLLRRKVLGKAVEVDVEKGLEENAMERREGIGPGWKEYTEVHEKATSDLLVPLVGAFLSQRETDVTDANPFRMPLAPNSRLSTLHHCLEPPAPSIRQQAGPIPVLEGDISDTHDLDHAPVFPPGLSVPAKAVAADRPISARLNPLSQLGPLDTGVLGITSWPVLAPTPVEEMRSRVNGQGEQLDPDIKDDVAPPDGPSALSPKSSCQLEITPISPSLPVLSDGVDPFADPPDPVHSLRFEASLDVDVDVSPACAPRSVTGSLDDSHMQPSDTGWPGTIDSVSAPSIICPSLSVIIPDSIFAVNVPLPESPPMSPKAVSPLLSHTLPLDTISTTAVIFGGELSPSVGVSDQELPSLIITAPVLTPIVTVPCLEDANEALCSPFSDSGSSSGSDSSGPETPTELKQELPFSSALELSSKNTPRLQLPVHLPLEEGVDEDVEFIDDFVMVGQQAPDPPSPTIDITSPEWTTSKFPGSFEEVTSNRARPGHKSVSTITVADVPPLTADMIQLCHALLAVSNCAGLVAQFVVGFSMWWSLTLVPA